MSNVTPSPGEAYFEQDVANEIYSQTGQVLVASLQNVSPLSVQYWIVVQYSCVDPSQALPGGHFRLFVLAGGARKRKWSEHTITAIQEGQQVQKGQSREQLPV